MNASQLKIHWIYHKKQPPEVFYKKGGLKNVSNFTGKTSGRVTLLLSNFIKNETLAPVFSSEFWDILKNTFFREQFSWLLLALFIL